MAPPLDASVRRFCRRCCHIHRIRTELVWSWRVLEFGQRGACVCSASAGDSRQRDPNADAASGPARNSRCDAVTDGRNSLVNSGKHAHTNGAANNEAEGDLQLDGEYEAKSECEGNPEGESDAEQEAKACCALDHFTKAAADSSCATEGRSGGATEDHVETNSADRRPNRRPR